MERYIACAWAQVLTPVEMGRHRKITRESPRMCLSNRTGPPRSICSVRVEVRGHDGWSSQALPPDRAIGPYVDLAYRSDHTGLHPFVDQPGLV